MTRERVRVDPIPYIPFDRDSPLPFYRQIYDGYRTAILSGRLLPGQRVPSTRTIAAELQISRIPALAAVDRLVQEGYLKGRPGSGTYVADTIPDEQTDPIRWLLRPTHDQPASTTAGDPVAKTEGPLGTFRVSHPALDRFARDTIAQLSRRHGKSIPSELMMYGDPAGYRPLRDAIAGHLRSVRAVDCDASQVIIVTGSQMGIRMSAMTLTTPESLVCMEEPGYLDAREALSAANAIVVPVAVDSEGIEVSLIRRVGGAVKMVYVTPSHQYPLGMSMSIPRRIDLTDWALSHDAWILEDDHDNEFRYGGRPLSSLQGMSAGGHVIYLGSFSSVLFPALRVGYLVVPPHLVDSFTQARISLDIFSPILPQVMLADFIREGHLARHIRRMRKIYRSRRDTLIAAIRTAAADVLTLGSADSGLDIVAFLPSQVDDREVVRRAGEVGLFPRALSPSYATSAARSGLLLGFANSDEPQLVAGVGELAALIRELC